MLNFRPLRMLAAGLAFATAAVLAVASPAVAAPPVNDDVSAATAVTGVPFTDTVNTSGATFDSETDAGCGVATVWYRWTAPADGSVEFNTVGSDYDTTLALFTGEPPNLVLEECNDDSSTGCRRGSSCRPRPVSPTMLRLAHAAAPGKIPAKMARWGQAAI